MLAAVKPGGQSFQSTHPLRGATGRTMRKSIRFFISIHAPLAGCDTSPQMTGIALSDFNPRTPCGVRLLVIIVHRAAGVISIYAPLAGCDAAPPSRRADAGYFNPRTPCGVRHRRGAAPRRRQDFNPRTPCGVRRLFLCFARKGVLFQSTHPLRGATRARAGGSGRVAHFNPRTPCGVRLRQLGLPRLETKISIHAPLAGCDCRSLRGWRSPHGFQSTHPLRGATNVIVPPTY